jgi:hypothetical protein
MAKYNVYSISKVGTIEQCDNLLLSTDDIEEAKKSARYDKARSYEEKHPESFDTEIRVYTDDTEIDYNTVEF